MRNFIIAALVVCTLVSTVKAAEPVNVEAAAQAAGEKAAQAVRDAQVKAQRRAADAARRASRTWGECLTENGRAAYGVARTGVCYLGAGVANADGYVAGAVAIPSGYVAATAFGAGASCAAAAK
jgi:ubiquinone biosynthesis protein UbiJ